MQLLYLLSAVHCINILSISSTVQYTLKNLVIQDANDINASTYLATYGTCKQSFMPDEVYPNRSLSVAVHSLRSVLY